MQTVRLIRSRQTDAGTEGTLSTDGFACRTFELPWRGNIRAKSCIPPGSYSVRMVHSPRFGRIYGLFGTEPRGNILIHSGNYAGDVGKGYKSHVQGCILLGKYFGTMDGQRAILLSRPTLRAFMDHMRGEPFTLIIEDQNADNSDRTIE